MHTTIDTESALHVVAADHPSLDDDVSRFAETLRSERRTFGPSGAANPKPFPSLVERLRRDDGGVRLAALVDGEVVGLARVDRAGEVLIAVAASHRGRGIGTSLASHLVERARAHGYGRLVLRSSRRSLAATSLGRSMGFAVVDQGRGRIDLILDLAPASYSA
jgi:GNAT superfamily N-acetyltransferase